jgi:hypothetical protein
MQLRVASHLYGDTLLEARFGSEWHEIRHVLQGCLVPQAAAAANALLEVEDSITRGLLSCGWEQRAAILVDASGRIVEGSLPCDFAKNGVFVEVELGQEDALYRSLFKFLVAGTQGAAEVGVLVVATEALAAGLDAKCASFEQALEVGLYRYGGIALPFVIVGIDLRSGLGHAEALSM